MQIENLIRLEQPAPVPRNAFRGDATAHLSRAQISYIPQARAGDVALDLGCWDLRHRRVLEQLGYRYCGVDIVNRGAQALADAHALPFRASAFALVLCISVLQYLVDPHGAMREIARVLQPGGYLVGSVAFLEPWDRDSLFHLTPAGLGHVLVSAGLTVDHISVRPRWHVLQAQLQMGPLRRLPSFVSRIVGAPFLWLLRGHGFAGRMLSRDGSHHRTAAMLARHAGAFFFVAQRPGAVA